MWGESGKVVQGGFCVRTGARQTWRSSRVKRQQPGKFAWIGYMGAAQNSFIWGTGSVDMWVGYAWAGGLQSLRSA